MSGITPLIDTLLHQVLGRTADVAAKRGANAPIQPIPHGEGPRALQGDAGLDGRPVTTSLDNLKRLPTGLDGQRQPAQGGASAPVGSTQTHFSPAARSIADVLLRFPAPPSTVRTEAPLMADNERPAVATVATRLETSIRDSGLFYESHLKRWFQGEAPRQQIMREPQMQLAPRQLPASASPPTAGVVSTGGAPLQAGAAPPVASNNLQALLMSLPPAAGSGESVNRAIIPGSVLLPVARDGMALGSTGSLPLVGRGEGGIPVFHSSAPQGGAMATAPGVSATPAALANPLAANPAAEARPLNTQGVDMTIGREMSEARSVHGGREVVHESLQSLVRHQLEMLVTPTIRWEGDVWAGIFLSLVINLPRDESSEQSGEQGGEEQQGWRSEMSLDVPNLGQFRVALWLYRSVLSIDFTASSEDTFQRLEAGVGALEQRLGALDFERVQLKVRPVALEQAYDDFAG